MEARNSRSKVVDLLAVHVGDPARAVGDVVEPGVDRHLALGIGCLDASRRAHPGRAASDDYDLARHTVLRLQVAAEQIRPPWLTFVYYIACRQGVKGMTDMTKSTRTSANSVRKEEHVEAIVSSIGPKVKKLRQEQRLSLQQLAVKAEVSAAAIHKIERNDMVPTITTLLKVATALDRPVTYFVERDRRSAGTGGVHAAPRIAPPSSLRTRA